MSEHDRHNIARISAVCHGVNRAEIRPCIERTNDPFISVVLFRDEWPAGMSIYLDSSEAAQNLADQFASTARMLRDLGK